jgi:hypothetical protein
MTDTLSTVLLLALPASGKSEVRKYLAQLPEEESRRDFHMGPTVQLDDFPYVHMMRRIDDGLAGLGSKRQFFQAPDKPFLNPKDWGTLIALINEDYQDLVAKKVAKPKSAAELLFERFDAAAKKVGAPERLRALDKEVRTKLAGLLEKEARELLAEKHKNCPDSLSGKTLVIEFARGGPHGSKMPLPDSYGYRYSLGHLSQAILEKAVILYVWVTPEESRRKNQERADPNNPGSILHHGVPIDVMMNDYGCDDMDWLEANAKTPGTVTILAEGKTYHLPVGRFDNRVDKTSFIRNDAKQWKPEQVQAVHQGLKTALDKLARLTGLKG